MSPAKRRAHGTGSVTQRKDGYWIGRYEAGYTPSGARRRRTVTARTEAEAKRRLTEAMRKVAAEGMTDEGGGRLTVKGWSSTWLEMHRQKVRPTTYTTNAGSLGKWVIPTIGHKRLSALTPTDIRAIGKAVTDAGLSTTTARQAQTVALGMLKAARLEGHSVPQRIFDTEIAPVAINDRDAIPIGDAEKILHQAAKEPQQIARWALALLAGMRPAEARGLRWSDVDLDNATVTIEWQLQQLPYLDPKDKARGFSVPVNHESQRLYLSYHLTRPKNRRGLRVIPMHPLLAKALQQWKDLAPENPWNLVFTEADERSGRKSKRVVWSKHTDAEHWRRMQTLAGVSGPGGRHYANYENRHTTATLLMSLGVPAVVIEQIVGHSEMVSKKFYQHVSQEMGRDAVTQMGAMLNLPELEG